MKVFELSKEFGITNKDMIEFLKSKGFKVSSHSQNLTDEMIETARKELQPTVKETEKKEEVTSKKTATSKKTVPPKQVKKYAPDDQIPCRSLVPWRVTMLGVDNITPYKWSGFGDIEYVAYRDLQSWRRKSIVKDGKIFIEDPDLCDLWKYDLEGIYQKYIGIDYPEEFFEKSDADFEQLLRDSSETFKEVIKYTAIDMIRNENYPSVRKINIIDEVLGTGIKEFL